MFLKTLHLVNFKNYEDQSFLFEPGVNVISGNNGKGKTNLLDAIHYMSFCKSFLNPIDSQNIRHEMPFFVIEAAIDKNNKEEIVYCGLKRNQKKQFKRNKKEYEKLADHIGLFPLVIVSPFDAELVLAGGEERRRFLDALISQFNHSYLIDLMQYNRILQQRNALLKQFFDQKKFDIETLSIYDEQLASAGHSIYTVRKQFIEEFVPLFQKNYAFIAENDEIPTLQYESHLNDAVSLLELLQQNHEKDRYRMHTSKGIHRDDLGFMLNGFPIKRYGSQGQQKTYLTALKMAEFEYLKEKTQQLPFLILDDIFDKLDDRRVTKLLQRVVSEDFGQVFITDTAKLKIQGIFTTFGTNVHFIDL